MHLIFNNLSVCVKAFIYNYTMRLVEMGQHRKLLYTGCFERKWSNGRAIYPYGLFFGIPSTLKYGQLVRYNTINQI